MTKSVTEKAIDVKKIGDKKMIDISENMNQHSNQAVQRAILLYKLNYLITKLLN